MYIDVHKCIKYTLTSMSLSFNFRTCSLLTVGNSDTCSWLPYGIQAWYGNQNHDDWNCLSKGMYFSIF